MEFIQIMYTAYIEAVYFTDTPDASPEAELTDEFCYQARKDCEAFYDTSMLLGLPIDTLPPEGLGHDFWLTRNGHGSGFWDAGRPYRGFGTILTCIAKSFSNSESEFKHEVAPPKPEPFNAAKWIFQRETEDGYAELTDAEAEFILYAARNDRGHCLSEAFVGNPMSVYASCSQECLLEEVAALQRVVDAAKGE